MVLGAIVLPDMMRLARPVDKHGRQTTLRDRVCRLSDRRELLLVPVNPTKHTGTNLPVHRAEPLLLHGYLQHLGP